MLRTISQNNRLYGLLGKLKMDNESKEDLVFYFTKERTFHSSEMLYNECQNLIEHLNDICKGRPHYINPEHQSGQRQRRKLFAICHEMRWTIDGIVDKNKLFKWVQDYGYLHKPLMKYTYDELPQLVTQFEQVLKHFYAKR